MRNLMQLLQHRVEAELIAVGGLSFAPPCRDYPAGAAAGVVDLRHRAVIVNAVVLASDVGSEDVKAVGLAGIIPYKEDVIGSSVVATVPDMVEVRVVVDVRLALGGAGRLAEVGGRQHDELVCVGGRGVRRIAAYGKRARSRQGANEQHGNKQI